MEACCRWRDVEEFASRALEMRCRRRDIEVWSVLFVVVEISSFRSSRLFGQTARGGLHHLCRRCLEVAAKVRLC